MYSCLWLLALVKHCIKQEVVKTHLLEIQAAFMGLLGDNNDLVQDAASKGIAIVYEACTEDQRDGMVNNLLDTILGKKPQEVKKVTESTKVFQEGELGKVPDSVGDDAVATEAIACFGDVRTGCSKVTDRRTYW